MVHPGAEVAVIELLAAPGLLAAADRGPAEQIDGGPVARIVRGKGFAARRETIEILKQRHDRERCLFATRFVDQSGIRWEYLVVAEHDGGGWRAHGVAGGSDGHLPSGPAVALMARSDLRSSGSGAAAPSRLPVASPAGSKMSPPAPV